MTDYSPDLVKAARLHVNILSEDHELLPRDISNETASSKHADRPLSASRMLSSQFKDLWKTPVTMLSLFMAALIVAVAHLSMFITLDGKIATGPHSTPQSYVATISHFLGLTFRWCLCGALFIAFTQCLWRLLRVKAMKVSTADTLLKITRNPFLLTRPGLIRTAPTLFVLALFTVVLPLAITFPQGALIVVSHSAQSISDTTVPTYNGSFIGNRSVTDARSTAFALTTIAASALMYSGNKPIIQRIGRLILANGDITPSVSPCGLDCSYSIEFEGPYLRCNTSSQTFSQSNPQDFETTCPYNAFMATSAPTGIYEAADFNISVQRTISNDQESGGAVQNFDVLSCTPSRASYLATFSYSNGLRTISRETTYISPLNDMVNITSWGWPITDDCINPALNSSLSDIEAYIQCTYYTPALWSQPQLDIFTAYNHLALVYALLGSIEGNYTERINGEFFQDGDNPSFCGSQGGTNIADTRFNTQRDSIAQFPAPVFSVTEELLNEALFNITISAALQLGFYTDVVSANVTNTYTVYSFAKPYQLILPYFLCLGISLPFLFLGIRSLRLNGASAMDGGLLQILMTTTGSEKLSRAAAAGCIGGRENVPVVLNDVKVRFGEIIGSTTEAGVARAGFGLEDEVTTLRRGVSYGI